MEKQTIKKISTVSFMIAGIILGVTVSVLFKALAGSFGPVQRIYGSEVIRHGLPVLAGLALFLYLQLSAKVLSGAEEVILEVSKVNWPARKDVSGMTIVVIVMVFIASFLLLGVDTLAREVVKLLVDVPAILG